MSSPEFFQDHHHFPVDIVIFKIVIDPKNLASINNVWNNEKILQWFARNSVIRCMVRSKWLQLTTVWRTFLNTLPLSDEAQDKLRADSDGEEAKTVKQRSCY